MGSWSESKIEVIIANPILIKAGIPLVLSVAAAFLSAKILSRRGSASSDSSPFPNSLQENEEDELERSSPNTSSQSSTGEGNRAIEDLKWRELELELEMRFLLYQTERQMEFMALLARQFEMSRLEKELVRKKARNLRRRLRDKCRVAREQKLRLHARDAEMSSIQVEMDRKDRVIQELHDETGLMRRSIDQLELEKTELSSKLYNLIESERSPASLLPKIEEEEFQTKEEYGQLVKELERIEIELIILRWSNACLRHQFIRCQQGKDNLNSNFNPSEKEEHFQGNNSSDDDNCEVVHLDREAHTHRYSSNDDGSGSDNNSTPTHHQGFSRKKGLVTKLFKKVAVRRKASG